MLYLSVNTDLFTRNIQEPEKHWNQNTNFLKQTPDQYTLLPPDHYVRTLPLQRDNHDP